MSGSEGRKKKMNKIYKLAANFNTVEFVVSDEEIERVARERFLDDSLFLELTEGDEEIRVTEIEKDAALKFILQREYDFLSNIKTVKPAQTIQAAEPEFEPASDKQIAWAKSLGMRNAEKSSKQEVWAYIQANR
jgi:hypothetical protein